VDRHSCLSNSDIATARVDRQECCPTKTWLLANSFLLGSALGARGAAWIILRALQAGGCFAATWPARGISMNRRLIRIAQLFPAFLFLLAASLLSPARATPSKSHSQPLQVPPSGAGAGLYTYARSRGAKRSPTHARRHELYFLDVAYELLLLVLFATPSYRSKISRSGSARERKQLRANHRFRSTFCLRLTF